MNRFYLLTFAYLILLGPVYFVDTELSPYKDRYDSIIDNHCKVPYIHKFSLSFVSDMDSVVGLCQRNIIETSVNVEISRKYWDEASEKERFAVVAHELTHCYFGVDHVQEQWHYMYKEVTDVVAIEDQIINTVRKYCGR